MFVEWFRRSLEKPLLIEPSLLVILRSRRNSSFKRKSLCQHHAKRDPQPSPTLLNNKANSPKTSNQKWLLSKHWVYNLQEKQSFPQSTFLCWCLLHKLSLSIPNLQHRSPPTTLTIKHNGQKQKTRTDSNINFYQIF